jgi:CheY-like chemotaxis protein
MVLLVDDDEVTLYALALRISQSGYTPMAAADVEEALRLLRERLAPPHAIVLDWKLPRVSGLEALRTIRAERDLASVPVIVYSAYLDDVVGREAMAAGATECVLKGARPGDDHLFSTLDRYLPRR